LSIEFSTNCAPNFIQNSNILITLGNTNAENKGLECAIAYNDIKSRFPSHVFLYQLCSNRDFTICGPYEINKGVVNFKNSNESNCRDNHVCNGLKVLLLNFNWPEKCELTFHTTNGDSNVYKYRVSCPPTHLVYFAIVIKNVQLVKNIMCM